MFRITRREIAAVGPNHCLYKMGRKAKKAPQKSSRNNKLD